MNRVCLIARLVRDPELRDASGTSVCNMRAAFNTRRKVAGEWTEVGNFVNLTAFGRQAELADQYLSKGREVGVDGRLEVREYEHEGQKRISVDVIVDSLKFIGGRDGGSDGGAADAPDDDIPF